MRIGVADFGMNVWDGACFDLEERLKGLRGVGYEGVERLEAISASQALERAARFRRLGMDFATCRGPNPEVSLQWTAALGKGYQWANSPAKDFDTFCRQVRGQVAACARYGLAVGLHNHLGTPVESQSELEAFLDQCPECGLILDTAHLAAAGGDPLAILRRYPDRLVAVHLKDWITLKPEVGLERWGERGRFCELGAGNIGLDNAAVMRALADLGYEGWVFVEQDTHLQDPLKDLAHSREYLRKAGF
ncbi:MAG TPA: sugar phosphate isomerase/epimerase [Armatimonadota bacterium]|jgi:sugar phosphate isomerase/epimerase